MSSTNVTDTVPVVSPADVTVGISTSGTGTEGTDYATISDITISAGSTTGTASFTPSDDSVYEGNETGIVAISNVSGGSATEDGTQSVTITITENESSPTITLATSSASSIAENAGSSLTLTATSSIVADEDITVTISTSGTERRVPTMALFLILQFQQEQPLVQHRLHQRMIVSMKVMKQELLQ